MILYQYVLPKKETTTTNESKHNHDDLYSTTKIQQTI